MSILPGAAARNFKNCGHKSVELTYFRGHVDGAQLTCPKTVDTETPVTVHSSSIRARDKLYKHVTSGYYSNAPGSETKFTHASIYDGSEYAYEHIGRTAARTICDGCEYSGKSPNEVLAMQAGA